MSESLSKDYCIISTPTDPVCSDLWKTLNSSLANFSEHCKYFKFPIPRLNITQLDQLLLYSDELQRIENTVEATIYTLFEQLNDVLENSDRIDFVKNICIEKVPLHNYLITFVWDVTRYPNRQPFGAISYLFDKEINRARNVIPNVFQRHNYYTYTLSVFEKLLKGNLLTAHLGLYVRKEDFVLNSEFLTTCLVVIPRNMKNDWLSKYERLHSEIVPSSSRIIAEDFEFSLFSVVLFKRAREPFKIAAKKEGFFVRDYNYDEATVIEFKKQYCKALYEKQNFYKHLVEWCKNNFSECFIPLVHVKCSKLFIESVLRYGLPADFQTTLLVIERKETSKVLNNMNSLFGHLKTSVVTHEAKGNTDKDLDKENNFLAYVNIRIDYSKILTAKTVKD